MLTGDLAVWPCNVRVDSLYVTYFHTTSNEVAMPVWYFRPCLCGLPMSVGHYVCHPVTYLLMYCFSLFYVRRLWLCEEPIYRVYSPSTDFWSRHRIRRLTT